MAVDHREAIAVVHRQRGRGDVARADAQVVGDRLGVGGQVVMGEPDQLGRAGGAGGRQHQRQVGVQVVRAARAAFEEVAAAQHDVGVVGVDDRLEVPGVVAGDEDGGVAAHQRGEVADHRVDVVGAGQQDEPAGAAEPLGDGADAGGEVAVRQRSVRSHQGGPVAVRGEAAPEAGGDARGAGQDGTHRGRILGKPYLCQRESTHRDVQAGSQRAARRPRAGGSGFGGGDSPRARPRAMPPPTNSSTPPTAAAT